MFDDALLDEPEALRAADPALRHLAESGARVRREIVASEEQTGLLEDPGRPRAVVVAGREARLMRAVLEPSCPVPLVAWNGPGLPGWAGHLDMVFVLAQDEADGSASSTVQEAVRRGCGLVVACPAGSAAASYATGRYATVLPIAGDDALAGTIVLLGAMHRVDLAPLADGEEVATALDEIAVACSPFRDLATNPAKEIAQAVGDATPLLWGGSVLAARAARRVAEAIRRSTGRNALAGEVEHLLPLIEAAAPRDLFADPFEDGAVAPRNCFVLLDDGTQNAVIADQRRRMNDACEQHDVRTDVLSAEHGSEVARYASLVALGAYTAVYLGVALARSGEG